MSDWARVMLTSLATGVVLQPILISLLRSHGIIDNPNYRSSHTVSTPRGGGVAVLVAIGVGLLWVEVGWQPWVAYAGSVLLGAVGFADDIKGLGAHVRLAGLLAVGALAGVLLGSPLPGLVGVGAMAVWTASYVNAFNFMDGINGISALSGMVAGGAFVAIGVAYDSPAVAVLGGVLVGGCTSFLPFNLPRARVFLGDVGSYGLGFAIASTAWLAWTQSIPLFLALAPTLVYLADTGATLVTRARARLPLLEAHRSHTYQRLVVGGLSHAKVALFVAGVEIAVVVSCWVAVGQQGAIGSAMVGILLVGYLLSPRLIGKAKVSTT